MGQQHKYKMSDYKFLGLQPRQLLNNFWHCCVSLLTSYIALQSCRYKRLAHIRLFVSDVVSHVVNTCLGKRRHLGRACRRRSTRLFVCLFVYQCCSVCGLICKISERLKRNIQASRKECKSATLLTPSSTFPFTHCKFSRQRPALFTHNITQTLQQGAGKVTSV